MTQKVLKIGSSAGITIPKKTLKELGIKIGDEVEVSIRPVQKVEKEVLDWTDRFIEQYQTADRKSTRLNSSH